MMLGFESILSAQTMFPVLSPDEMAGHYQENDVAIAVREGILTGEGGAWDIISRRVSSIPEYSRLFGVAYANLETTRQIAFTDISNAIAAFVAFEWRSDQSPFDEMQHGGAALPDQAQVGLGLFYGEAGCSVCHSGKFQTDQRFHAMGEPQIGPGKSERFESHSRDVGRMRVTNDPADAYRFRTASLRNVTRTGPWGHAGAYSDLGAFLAHHSNPAAGLSIYDRDQAVLSDFTGLKDDWVILDTPEEVGAIEAAALPGHHLRNDEIASIIAFLVSLEDEVALRGRLGVPDHVPSGLRVDR